MKPSSPHPILAFFVDLSLVGSVWSVMNDLLPATESRVTAAIEIAAVFLLVLVLPVVYHWQWASRVSILTPGEFTAGVFRRDGYKVWLNPYGGSRRLLYGCVIYALYVNAPAVNLQSAASLLIAAVLIALVAVCLIGIGRGKPVGLLGLAAYRLWQAYASTGVAPFSADYERVANAYAGSLLLAVACGLVMLVYSSASRMQTGPAA